MVEKGKTKKLVVKLALLFACVLCYTLENETEVFANWTCIYSNTENADYDSKCWKSDEYRDMYPEFDTETGKEFESNDRIRIEWSGKKRNSGVFISGKKSGYKL